MQQPKKINKTAPHKLSVLIHQDGLCFYIHHDNGIVVSTLIRDFKQILNPIELLEAITAVYIEESILQQEFNTVTLVYNHDIFTMVPNAYFQTDKAPDYLKYNTRLLKTDVISVDDPVATLSARCIYIAYENINNYFHDHYGTFNYYHYTSKLLKELAAFKQSGENLVYITLQETSFYITLIKKNKLILHNVFTYEAAEDVLYYIMFTTAQNGFDPEIIETFILQNKKNQHLFDLLYTYIRKVTFIEHSKDLLIKMICA